MTQAITARRDGDNFQARLFWKKAARLLDSQSSIVKVGFESGPKSFDDIWVEYDANRAPQSHGHPLVREHIQCKWHVSPNAYNHTHLIDPEFINANALSFLQRARAAQLKFAPDGKGIRFKLVTNWRIELTDPLRAMLAQRSNTIKLDHLFGTKTDNSAAGNIRKSWREHLEIDEIELRLFAQTLAFSEATDSLDELRENLNNLFGCVGLRRIPDNESAFLYDDLVYQWMGQGRLEFDKVTFLEACKRENLFDGNGNGTPLIFGVKSFEHATDRLEDRCSTVLDLVQYFDERQIRSEADWSVTLYPVLKNFLLIAANTGERIRLILDAHLTLAFAAGSILNIKSGRIIELEQRTISKSIWSPDDMPNDPSWSTWVFKNEEIGNGTDLAVVISLTHDATAKANAYIKNALPNIGSLLIAHPNTGPSSRSVICGRHAFDLAESLTAEIKSVQEKKPTSGSVHLFPACPASFAFFLGQRQIALGRTLLYEFDFEGENGGSYKCSMSLPVKSSST